MQRYAVMIEVDDDLMYVSEDNPFDYSSMPKVFDTWDEAEVEAKIWEDGTGSNITTFLVGTTGRMEI
jgi:hypothetical protein